MTLLRFECVKYGKHTTVLVEVESKMADATVSQLSIPCPDCGRNTNYSWVDSSHDRLGGD